MSETKVLRTVTDAQGESVVYELTRKPVKNINLRIRPDGSVAVSANSGVALTFLDDFVRSKAEYIRAAKERIKARGADGQDRQCSQCIVRRGEKNVFLYAPPDSTKEQRATAMEKWYHREAAWYLPVLCKRWYPSFAEKGIAYPILRIRKMTSRWGVCQPKKGMVTLSTLLMQVPKAAAEYVVVHEFTHFLVPNHSPRFYEEVALILPDWKERKAMLG
ncbi:MAG: M48 family metallopeptidase [Lachnospiraceae bacterium]|nr:M48 family metallopeptidase [Lachnospiraceae bacterium]